MDGRGIVPRKRATPCPVLDYLGVPQRARSAQACRRLAGLMLGVGLDSYPPARHRQKTAIETRSGAGPEITPTIASIKYLYSRTSHTCRTISQPSHH